MHVKWANILFERQKRKIFQSKFSMNDQKAFMKEKKKKKKFVTL